MTITDRSYVGLWGAIVASLVTDGWISWMFIALVVLFAIQVFLIGSRKPS